MLKYASCEKFSLSIGQMSLMPKDNWNKRWKMVL